MIYGSRFLYPGITYRVRNGAKIAYYDESLGQGIIGTFFCLGGGTQSLKSAGSTW